MGRNVVVGIIVSAKDAASAVLHGVGASAKGAGSAIEELAKKGSEGFKGVEEGIRTLDHAMSLGRRGIEVFKTTIGESIQKALEWRSKGDSSVRAIHDFGNAFDTTRARIGDQFLPVIRGAIYVLTPMLAQLQRWIHLNSQVVSSTIIDWTVKLSTGLVNGIAWGVLQVIRAWTGWKLIVTTVEAAINVAFGAILSGIGTVLGGMQKLASMTNMDDLAKQIGGAKEAVEGLGTEFDKSADTAVKAIYEEMRALDDKEKTLEKVRSKIIETIEKVGVKAYQHLAEAAKGTGKRSAEEEEALTTRVLQNYAFKSEANKAYNDAVAAANEAEYSRELEVEQKKMQEILQLNDGTTKGLLRSWAAYEQQKATLGQSTIDQLDRSFDREFKAHTKEIAGEIRGIFSEVVSGIVSTFQDAFSGINDMEDVSVKKFAIKAQVYNAQTKQMMEVTTDVVDKMTNAQVIALAKQGKKAEEITLTMRQNTKTIGAAIGQVFKGIGATVLESAEKFVTAKAIEVAADKAAALFSIHTAAAEAGAKSGAASAGEAPFPINLVIMGAAIAAATALVLKLAGTFHTGGLIPGPEGQERMIRAQAGEIVLPIPVARAIRSGGAMPTSADMAHSRASISSGSSKTTEASTVAHGPTVNIVQQLLGTQDKTAIRRNLNDSLLPVIREWIRTGALRLVPGK